MEPKTILAIVLIVIMLGCIVFLQLRKRKKDR